MSLCQCLPLFCNVSNYTEEQATLYRSIVVDIRVVMASLSFIGSVFVICLIWLFKKYRFFIQRLLLYLSFSAFLASTAYILGRVDYDPTSVAMKRFCKFQGFWLLYTDWTVMLSMFCITANLLWSVCTKRRVKCIEVLYLVIIYAFPLPVAAVGFWKDSFGPSGAWCWIRNENEPVAENCTDSFFNCTTYTTGVYLQFGLWYVPLYVMILILFVMYLAIIVKVRLSLKRWQGAYDPHIEQSKALLRREVRPLLWYPTIFFAICLFPLINRIVATADHPYFPLYVLHVLTSPLTGALIALAFALDREMLRKLNWRSIKASFRYRNSDSVAKEYIIGSADEDNAPLITGSTEYQSIEESVHSASSSSSSVKRD